MIISSCVNIGANGIISFLFMVKLYSIVYIYVPHIHHLFFVSEHSGCFPVSTTVNCVAMSIVVHVSFRIMVVSRYMLRSGIAK